MTRARRASRRRSARPGAGGGARPGPAPARRKLRLTKLKMSPRRFAVSHRRAPRGTRLDGTRISWRLNRAATVRLTFQRRGRARAGSGSGAIDAQRARPGTARCASAGASAASCSAAALPARRRPRAAGRPDGRPALVPGPQGMSVEDDRPRRFGRRRADFEALEVAGRVARRVRAELMLLREENARLKAARAPSAGHRPLLGRARSLPRRADDLSVADETTRVLVEGLVIRGRCSRSARRSSARWSPSRRG